jgi:rod shape-determining protein MreC
MARLMFYILLAVVLMALDYRGRHVEQLRHLATRVVEPAFMLVEAPFSLSLSLRQNWRDRQALVAERNEFERLLRDSRAQLLLAEELRRENAELRRLLGASRLLETRFQTAELRNIDLNPYSHRVLVNRGASHGLIAGQPVIDVDGVVGQLDQVLQFSAMVVLISDPDHALPVRVRRTRLRTIAYGSGRIDQLRLTDLPMNVDLEVGDLLVTSGLGGRFPSGLPVAEVVSVERPDGEAFALATARPLARLDGARHFLVLETEIDERAEPPVAVDEDDAGDLSLPNAETEPDQPADENQS